jgi:hypothetical protein
MLDITNIDIQKISAPSVPRVINSRTKIIIILSTVFISIITIISLSTQKSINKKDDNI